jgi:hypothetical protein
MCRFSGQMVSIIYISKFQSVDNWVMGRRNRILRPMIISAQGRLPNRCEDFTWHYLFVDALAWSSAMPRSAVDRRQNPAANFLPVRTATFVAHLSVVSTLTGLTSRVAID